MRWSMNPYINNTILPKHDPYESWRTDADIEENVIFVIEQKENYHETREKPAFATNNITYSDNIVQHWNVIY